MSGNNRDKDRLYDRRTLKMDRNSWTDENMLVKPKNGIKLILYPVGGSVPDPLLCNSFGGVVKSTDMELEAVSSFSDSRGC